MVCLILLLLVVGFALAQVDSGDDAVNKDGVDAKDTDDSTSTQDRAQSDYEAIQGGIDQVEGIYDPGTGEFNESSVFWGISEAEKNIAGINEWLDSNVAWLQFVFRMVPALSWLFFFNILFILVGLVHLGLNAAKYGLIQEEWLARVAGFSLFTILLVTNVYVSLAQIVINILDVFYNQILTWTNVAIALVVVGIIIAALVALAYFAGPFLYGIWKFIAPLVGKKTMETGAERATVEAKKELSKIKEEREKIKKFTDAAFSNAA